jgi:heptosyltransferase-1
LQRDRGGSINILIVKTSSFGDIVQAFYVLSHLKRLVPNASIDWVVDPAFQKLVQTHPLIQEAIVCNLKKYPWQSLKNLSRKKYDLLFDLQGNCKSGIISFFAKAKVKVGYGFFSAREWPGALALDICFEISRKQNIRSFYLALIEKYFQKDSSTLSEGVQLAVSDEDRAHLQKILSGSLGKKIMVCPGSNWENKRLDKNTWIAFLQKIEKREEVTFFLIWGNLREKEEIEIIAKQLKKAVPVDRLEIPVWQNLMGEMDLILAIDSGALHLAATTQTPSFSIFGPTCANIFKPMGPKHFVFQGSCPYQKTFDKQCPVLRTCTSGACMKNLTAEELFQTFTTLA